jgi:hypothetical protein
VQPLAEKPWATFMGRPINVPDMREGSQRNLGLFDKRGMFDKQRPELSTAPPCGTMQDRFYVHGS